MTGLRARRTPTRGRGEEAKAERERERAEGGHLLVHENRQWQVVKEVGKVLPHVGAAIVLEALVVEAVDLRDLPALVVAAEDVNAPRVAHLEGHNQRHRLDRVEAAVDIVAQKHVVCMRHLQEGRGGGTGPEGRGDAHEPPMANISIKSYHCP